MTHTMVSFLNLCYFLTLTFVSATPVVWDGRVPFNLTEADLDSSIGPYLTVVKGQNESASHYTTLLNHTQAATPLWNTPKQLEQAFSVIIDNTSVFVPGGGAPQYGFRRTDLIAQPPDGDHDWLNENVLDVNKTVFHFSIKQDIEKPLNYSHEYQIVYIEPSDGSHVFGIQLGSPFTNPTGTLPAPGAHSFKVLDHALNVLYQTPFTPGDWHNFAVQVDWVNRTLGVFYSRDSSSLKAVTEVVSNNSTSLGSAGQGDFHIALLKLPLVDPNDTAAEQSDVVHYGIQEGTTEGLIYSGVFVEQVIGGVSTGYGHVVPALV